MTYAALWSPIAIGALVLRHRLVMAAMGSGFPAADGAVTDRLVRYLARRAEGGVALVTTEATAVDASGAPFPGVLRADDDTQLPGLRRLADAVHAAGAPISMQLYHAGRQMSRRMSGRQPLAPSAIPCPLVREMPRPLDGEEILPLIERFAEAAARAQAAGFDAVEVHGAHGYLVHQFLTPLANQRTDAWGGDLRGRARFALEVVRRIRARVGRGFPILFKLSAEDRLPGGLGIDDTLTVGRWLEEAGVDAVIVSAGTYGSFEWIVQPLAMPQACLRAYAARFSAAVTIPVVAVGRVNDPAVAANIVGSGDAALVAMGRALLSDPDLPAKARAGRGHDVRPCITCNDCLTQLMKGQPIRCAVNPEMGREAAFPPPPAAAKKRVLVVGGGAAGIHAALAARARGHDVTLFEAGAALGGRLRRADRPRWKKEAGALVPYLVRRLREAGVATRLDARVTVEHVRSLAPDEVIVATGARPALPDVPGIRGPNVVTAEQCLAGDLGTGVSAVVLGGTNAACEAACHLREHGRDVTLLAPGRDVARDVEPQTRKGVVAQLGRLGVRVLHETRVEEIRDGEVRFADGAGRRDGVSATLVVVAAESAPDDGLARALAAAGWTAHAVGDCAGVGDLAGAVHGATDVAGRL
jgi:2,4-dienoyl-CoA reductase-like NADH-dependent reductase (Old Yellow Enzyme family)/thioredoxin reductase